jgi:hypothetical protein
MRPNLGAGLLSIVRWGMYPPGHPVNQRFVLVHPPNDLLRI